MVFKTVDTILECDPRFKGLVVVDNGGVRTHDLVEHHRMVESVNLAGSAPNSIREAFDRARNLFLYAFFDYDLLVNGELQAFGALELALKHRLNKPGAHTKETLRNLADRARRNGIFHKVRPGHPIDRLEALVALRNALSHGTTDIHAPGAAMSILESCAWAIDIIFPPNPHLPRAKH
jgi:hypothetical protein